MIVDQNSSIFNYCKILDQINYTKEKFEELQQIADENNWEGLMLRKIQFTKEKEQTHY